MADPTSTLLDPALMARLAHLQFRPDRRMAGALVGHHRSPRHGSSIEFAEHKEYTPGDEIRHINWQAYAKSDKYYVKRYEDETNLRAFLLVDASASMGYGGEEGPTKLRYAATMAAAMAFLLLKQQDSVGLLIFSDRVRAYVPPRARSGHLQELCATLEEARAEGETDLGAALTHVIEHVGRRSVLFVLSDLFEEPARIAKALSVLPAGRHRISLLHVLHEHEIHFPFESLTLFQGMETTREVLAEPKVIRDTYLKELARFRDDVRRKCLERGVDYRLIDTSRRVDEAIVSLLAGDHRSQSLAV